MLVAQDYDSASDNQIACTSSNSNCSFIRVSSTCKCSPEDGPHVNADHVGGIVSKPNGSNNSKSWGEGFYNNWRQTVTCR